MPAHDTSPPTRFAVIGLVLLFACSFASPTWACDKDLDCKGDRICADGVCQAPKRLACTSDTDCPDEDICSSGECHAPEAPPPDRPVAPPPPSAPAPPAPTPQPDVIPSTGTIIVTADQPGRVLVDDREVGRVDGEPFRARGVAPGQHEVTVVFDSGGKSEQDVFAVVDHEVAAHLTVSKARSLFAHRKGTHFGVKAGAQYHYNTVVDADDGISGGGVNLAFLTNFGVAPAVDLRAGAELTLGGAEGAFSFMLGIPLELQLNLGSVYSMRFGVAGGLALTTALRSGDTVAMPFVGPQGSFATFRFGSKRELELAAEGGGAFAFSTEVDTVFVTAIGGVSLTYLFLAD